VWNRRDFLKESGILAVSAGAVWAQTHQPNVVVMLASGLADLTLEPTVRALHLRRLAQESVQFERSYVSCPETGPSQASLVTGRFPFASGVPRDGVLLPPDQPMVTQQFKAAGYQTAMIGDWRLSGEPPKSAETNLAIDFIKQNQMNPFFLLLAWHRADTSAVDDNAGRILDSIDDLNLRNDTIAVFTSDHGYGSGPLEPAVRIPLMLRYPRLKPGPRTGILASNVDLAPTLIALCGVNPGDSMQGRDLMREQPQSIYCAGQLGTPGEWRMLVRGLDKLVVDGSKNVTHLYNLGEDPLEMDNRARDPGLELKRNELKALLNDWMRRTGDGMDPSGLKLRARAEPQTSARSDHSAAPTDHRSLRLYGTERPIDRKPTE
jgi:arylsulfatase A-like enzyme